MPIAGGLIGIFLRYLWPFIKEWFFDKRAAARWWKKNYITVFFLALVGLSTYCSFKILMYAVTQKNIAVEQRHDNKLLQDRLIAQTTLSRRLVNDVEIAQAHLADVQTKVDTYEFWMYQCGMDYRDLTVTIYPTCQKTRYVAPSTGGSRRIPIRQHTPTKPDRSKTINERVKDIWDQS